MESNTRSKPEISVSLAFLLLLRALKGKLMVDEIPFDLEKLENLDDHDLGPDFDPRWIDSLARSYVNKMRPGFLRLIAERRRAQQSVEQVIDGALDAIRAAAEPASTPEIAHARDMTITAAGMGAPLYAVRIDNADKQRVMHVSTCDGRYFGVVTFCGVRVPDESRPEAVRITLESLGQQIATEYGPFPNDCVRCISIARDILEVRGTLGGRK